MRNKKLKYFMIGLVALIIIGMNFLYMGTIDTTYAIRFHEIIENGDISDFDRYFGGNIKIIYGDECISYRKARKNIKEYIESGERINCNSYGYDHDNFPVIGKTSIRFTLSLEENVLDLKYIKGLFFIKPISLELDTHYLTLYEVFFGRYKTDLKPVESNFPNIKEIDSVYYKSEIIGENSIFPIGPNDYRFSGYIVVSDEEGKRILNKYKWEDAKPEKFNYNDREVSPIITGFKEFHWLYSKEFYEDNRDENLMCKIYFDEINNIIYFDFQTY